MTGEKATGVVGVVGGGAAAISAVLWLESLDVESIWFCGAAGLGGLLHRVNNPVANFPPDHYDSGSGLANELARAVEDFERIREEVEEVVFVDDSWRLLSRNEERRCDAVILATGSRYRRLGIPGEEEGLGAWVSQSAARDAEKYPDRDVLVVGGGDAAFENALRLSEAGARVEMAIRSPQFRARKNYVSRVEADPKIEILPIPTVVEHLAQAGDGCVAGLSIDGEADRRNYACVFVRIGVAPVTPRLPDEVERDDRGFLVVDSDGATSAAGLFAAGDVTRTILRSVATSVGDGARGARAAAHHIGAFWIDDY